MLCSYLDRMVHFDSIFLTPVYAVSCIIFHPAVLHLPSQKQDCPELQLEAAWVRLEKETRQRHRGPEPEGDRQIETETVKECARMVGWAAVQDNAGQNAGQPSRDCFGRH